MHITTSTPRLLLLIFALGLTACGGGGSSTSASAPSADTNPPPAVTPTPPPANPGGSGNLSLSGTITVPQQLQSDGDTNDPNAVVHPNDTFSTAQPLLNPVTISGYLNLSAQGSAGRSQTSGDISDIYRVSLLAGQSLSLVIPQQDLGDLDLYTYPASCTDTTCSSSQCQQNNQAPVGNNGGSFQNAGANEKITISVTADYFIEVCAFSGYGTYTLTIGTEPVATTLSANDDFVAGEVITRYKAQSATARVQAAAAGLAAATSQGEQRATLLKLGPLGTLAATATANTSAVTAASVNLNPKRATAAAMGDAYLEKWDTLNAIANLRLQADVIYAEPNYILHTSQVPNDDLYRFQWHYPLINLPDAWDITTGSSTVIVAVIDTGIKAGHPDLQGQLVAGYDFIADVRLSGDGDGIDADPNDTGPTQASSGLGHHGTHVAGTVAARSNDAGPGVAGVAWQAKIMPLRVLGDTGGSSFDTMQAIRFAAGLPNDSGTVPPQKADIINLSLGSPQFLQQAQDVLTQAYNNGTIIVAAAGNENTRRLVYPASYDNVISVSAVAINKQITDYSNFGAKIDVAAPGGGSGDANGDGVTDAILSLGFDATTDNFIYTLKAGTSMAAPHVAGVLALMKAANPGLTPADVDALLAAGSLTEDLGAAGRDDLYGHGLINALKAVNAASNPGALPPAQLSVTPRTLSFGLAESVQTLQLSSVSQGATVTGISSSQTYASANPQTVDANGLGSYQISIDRSTLADGTYSANLSIQSSLGPVSVPLVFQVATANTGLQAEAGYLYALLLDPSTLEAQYQIELPIDTRGAYRFTFNNLVAGDYLLFAGSDFDNDGGICGVSESCGLYPQADSSNTLIQLSGDQTGLDFQVNYEIGFRTTAQAEIETVIVPEPSPFAVRRLR